MILKQKASMVPKVKILKMQKKVLQKGNLSNNLKALSLASSMHLNAKSPQHERPPDHVLNFNSLSSDAGMSEMQLSESQWGTFRVQSS